MVILYDFQKDWNLGLKCKHDKHEAAFRDRLVIVTFEKKAPDLRIRPSLNSCEVTCELANKMVLDKWQIRHSQLFLIHQAKLKARV